MHPSSLRPEGGAPASWTVYPSLGECDRKRNPAQTDSTRSTTLVLFLKGGTSLETGKHDSVGKVQVSSDSVPHGLKPRHASPRGPRPRGLRRAQTPICPTLGCPLRRGPKRPR